LGLGNCPHCEDHSCTCGWEYRNIYIKTLEERIKLIEAVLKYRKENPDVKFSGMRSEITTLEDKQFMEYLDKIINKQSIS